MSLFNPDISANALTQDCNDDTDPTQHFSSSSSLEETSFEQKPTPLFSTSAAVMEQPETSYNSPLFPQSRLEAQEMTPTTLTEKAISTNEAEELEITPSISSEIKFPSFEIEKIIDLINLHSAENKSATSIIINTLNSVGINLDTLLENAEMKEEEAKIDIQKLMREIQFFEEQMHERNQRITLLTETLEKVQSIKYEIKNSDFLKR